MVRVATDCLGTDQERAEGVKNEPIQSLEFPRLRTSRQIQSLPLLTVLVLWHPLLWCLTLTVKACKVVPVVLSRRARGNGFF